MPESSSSAISHPSPGRGPARGLARGLGRRPNRPGAFVAIVGLALLLGACAGDPYAPTLSPSRPGPAGSGYGAAAPHAGLAGPQVGRAYSVNGRTYVPHVQPGYDRVGIASWYGRRYHGRRTASGQRYDMNGHTAAHPTLPFGTRVRVTNLANGRAVALTINDRGPFVKGRIIDLTRHAAAELDFLRAGTARVRVQISQAR